MKNGEEKTTQWQTVPEPIRGDLRKILKLVKKKKPDLFPILERWQIIGFVGALQAAILETENVIILVQQKGAGMLEIQYNTGTFYVSHGAISELAQTC